MGGLWRLNQREEKGETDGLFCQGGRSFSTARMGTPLGPRRTADGRFFGDEVDSRPEGHPHATCGLEHAAFARDHVCSDTEPCFFRSGRLPGNF